MDGVEHGEDAGGDVADVDDAVIAEEGLMATWIVEEGGIVQEAVERRLLIHARVVGMLDAGPNPCRHVDVEIERVVRWWRLRDRCGAGVASAAGQGGLRIEWV